MKTKTVLYMDMFNPTETIMAKNKLVSELGYYKGRITQHVFENTKEAAQHKKCRCHHPNFIGGVCRFRNCAHDEAHHN